MPSETHGTCGQDLILTVGVLIFAFVSVFVSVLGVALVVFILVVIVVAIVVILVAVVGLITVFHRFSFLLTGHTCPYCRVSMCVFLSSMRFLVFLFIFFWISYKMLDFQAFFSYNRGNGLKRKTVFAL